MNLMSLVRFAGTFFHFKKQQNKILIGWICCFVLLFVLIALFVFDFCLFVCLFFFCGLDHKGGCVQEVVEKNKKIDEINGNKQRSIKSLAQMKVSEKKKKISF